MHFGRTVRVGDDEIAERARTIPGVLAVTVEQVTAAGRGAPAVVAEAQARVAQAPAVAAGAPAVAGAVSTADLLSVVPPAARIMRVEFDGGDYDLYKFLAELLRRGLPVYGFTEEIGDLEDAFMRITKGLVA